MIPRFLLSVRLAAILNSIFDPALEGRMEIATS